MEQTLILPSEEDTIVAVSTPPGTGGIAVIRISGPEVFGILERVWKGTPISGLPSHSARFGRIVDEKGEVLDEVVLTLFRSPGSFTGEDTAEISCHGSRWIQREIVNLLIRNGARAAGPGEFTQRAFVNGRLDLAQAEGIGDLIAASSRKSHRQAILQSSGAFSSRLNALREQLIEFACLLELELDFSEEDVEFADREKLRDLCNRLLSETGRLADTYAVGKAFKEGIPVVIAGQPNAGKSTLLNLILNDEKAIVSEIPGTTRDIIEDTYEIEGTLFRFIDTAGLRNTSDTIERLGIDRAIERLGKAAIIIWMIDLTSSPADQLRLIEEQRRSLDASTPQLLLLNKADLSFPDTIAEAKEIAASNGFKAIMEISAKGGKELPMLISELSSLVADWQDSESQLLVTNARHYAALIAGRAALERASAEMESDLSADFIAQDVREALHHLGTITGAITTPDLLQSVFSRFCIGK